MVVTKKKKWSQYQKTQQTQRFKISNILKNNEKTFKP